MPLFVVIEVHGPSQENERSLRGSNCEFSTDFYLINFRTVRMPCSSYYFFYFIM